MANRYYLRHRTANHPGREFTTVYVVSDGATEKRLQRLFPDARRITRTEALEIGFRNPSNARQRGMIPLSGFPSPVGRTGEEDPLSAAVQGTLEAISEGEWLQQTADKEA